MLEGGQTATVLARQQEALRRDGDRDRSGGECTQSECSQSHRVTECSQRESVVERHGHANTYALVEETNRAGHRASAPQENRQASR